ncbi:hypothetical protein [Macrococcus sp. DPC7161]|uniref:hypothetical protein n=1 Tax=Macrococcus sp. DPC7161 TaxID=2507060 RepID=UPI00100A4991|nr:hypothetical protein [Macrococcus sp. DPC7161]RXK17256.1 hypothetical protein ER639_11215 [Macrococcus sp. DPC7161]
MKKLMVIVLLWCLVLTGCSSDTSSEHEKQNDTKNEKQVDKVDKNEKQTSNKDKEKQTKVKKETAKKEKRTEKASSEHNTNSKSSSHSNSNEQPKTDQSVTVTVNEATTQTKPAQDFDSSIYNEARQCLITGTKCASIADTKEYSRAWNNLTSEGYLCQSGKCTKQSEPKTTESEVKKPSKPTKPSTEEVTDETKTDEQTTEESTQNVKEMTTVE